MPLRCLIDHLPYALTQLQVLDVLSEVIQAMQQIPWIQQGCQSRLPQGGCRAKPFLLAELNENAIRRLLERDGQRRRPTGRGARPRPDLHYKVVLLPQDLRPQSTAIELGHQSTGKNERSEVTMQDSSLHVFDYNRKAILSMSI